MLTPTNDHQFCMLYCQQVSLQFNSNSLTILGEIIDYFMRTQQLLENELRLLRERVKNLEEERSEIDSRDPLEKLSKSTQLNSKKAFDKSKLCPIDGCQRKYSSRIALKAHLRIKHPRFKAETLEYYP
jgi:hypothetical protein